MRENAFNIRQANRRSLLLAGVAGAACYGVSAKAFAQDFPNKPVRLVCGFTPGGSGDALARTLQPEVARLLGQQMIVENRPGAASNLASEAVAKASPDGYTLLLGGSFSHAVNPALFTSLPYDPLRDFVPVYYVGGAPSVFAVPANLPVNNLSEFIAYAKREAGKVNFGSAGVGSPGHIAGAYFNKQYKLEMEHVAYKGGGEAVRDLIAGQIRLNVSSVASVLPLAKSGRIKILALTGQRRAIGAPDIPTAGEAGLRDFDLDGWYGIFAPAATPAAVVSRLHGAFKQTLENQSILEKLHLQGVEPAKPISQEAFAQLVRTEIVRWREIVRVSGATPQ